MVPRNDTTTVPLSRKSCKPGTDGRGGTALDCLRHETEILSVSCCQTVHTSDRLLTDNVQIINRSCTYRVHIMYRSSTAYLQLIHSSSTDHQPIIYISSTPHQQIVYRSSTDHQHLTNRSSTDEQEIIYRSSTVDPDLPLLDVSPTMYRTGPKTQEKKAVQYVVHRICTAPIRRHELFLARTYHESTFPQISTACRCMQQHEGSGACPGICPEPFGQAYRDAVAFGIGWSAA